MSLRVEQTTATVTPSPALTLGLRLTAGLLWLSNVGWKVPPEFGRSENGCSGLCQFVDEGAENGVIAPWSWLMDNVVAPNLSLFGYLTLLTEFTLAVLLISGTLTRLAALVGVGQSLAIGLSVANAAGEWYWSYLLMIALHVAIFALAAGRVYGVDARLRQRRDRPRWLELAT